MSLQNLVLIINVYQLFISPISSSMFCLSLPLSLGCATEHCMCAHERNMYLGPNTRIQKLKKDAKVSSPHIWRWSGTSVKYPVLPSRFANLVYAQFMELEFMSHIGSECNARQPSCTLVQRETESCDRRTPRCLQTRLASLPMR